MKMKEEKSVGGGLGVVAEEKRLRQLRWKNRELIKQSRNKQPYTEGGGGGGGGGGERRRRRRKKKKKKKGEEKE